MADWFKIYADTLDRERYQAPMAMCPYSLNVLIWIMGKAAQTRCPIIQASKRDLAGAAGKLHIPFGDFMAGLEALTEFLTDRPGEDRQKGDIGVEYAAEAGLIHVHYFDEHQSEYWRNRKKKAAKSNPDGDNRPDGSCPDKRAETADSVSTKAPSVRSVSGQTGQKSGQPLLDTRYESEELEIGDRSSGKGPEQLERSRDTKSENQRSGESTPESQEPEDHHHHNDHHHSGGAAQNQAIKYEKGCPDKRAKTPDTFPDWESRVLAYFSAIPEPVIARWANHYQNINVVFELGNCQEWAIANESRVKDLDGLIVWWLKDEARNSRDRKRPRGGGAAPKAPEASPPGYSAGFAAVPEASPEAKARRGEWGAILSDLRAMIDTESFETWFAPLRCLAIDDSAIWLGVPGLFYRNWIANNYADQILERTGRQAIHYIKLNEDEDQPSGQAARAQVIAM